MKPRVLIADTELGAPLLAKLLGDPFDTRTQTTWDGAVRLLQEQKPSIVVVGYHFDETRPYRLIRYVHEQAATRELPVLLVRGIAVEQGPYADEEIRQSYRRLGASAYLALDKSAAAKHPEEAQRLRKLVDELLRNAG